MLYDKYDGEVNWSHANNTPITSQRVGVFECPSSPKHNLQLDFNPDGWAPNGTFTEIGRRRHYAGLLKADPRLNNTTFPATGTPPRPLLFPSSQFTSNGRGSGVTTNGMLPKNALKFEDVTDGTSNTIAVWESGGRPYVYQPRPEAGRQRPRSALRQRRRLVLSGQRHSVRWFQQGRRHDSRSLPESHERSGDVADESYGSTGFPTYGTEEPASRSHSTIPA